MQSFQFLAVASAAALMFASASSPSLADTCGSPRDGLICMSSQCRTGNGVWLKTTPLITGIELSNFNLNFPPGKPFALASSKGVKISISVPDSLSQLFLDFTQVTSTIGVGLPGGPPVGSLVVANVPARGDSTSKAVLIDLDSVVFAPASSDAAVVDAFTKVFAAITATPGPIPLGMSGVAANAANISDVMLPGMDPTDVCLENVQFKVTSTLIGLGGLKDTTITAPPRIIGGNPTTGLQLAVDVQIKNPSTITLQLNTDVTLALTAQNATVGSVVLPNFSLAAGTNTYTATGYLAPDPTNPAALRAAVSLIARFVAGAPSPIVVGPGRATNLPALDPAFSTLSIPQTLPGSAGQPLISRAAVLIATKGLDTSTSPPALTFASTVVAANPFDAPVAILAIAAQIAYAGVVCVQLSGAFAEGEFVVEPKASATSPRVQIRVPLQTGHPECDQQLTANLLRGTISVDVSSTLTISVGGFHAPFPYSQKNVTIVPDFTGIPV
ncbi:hypothetical protein DFJ73DRAFT_798685 [Zopfochytrium polystomum]|nr:hypothetical protein DFJ73DRAFT_798685 [Zopfochytrium polystomum]